MTERMTKTVLPLKEQLIKKQPLVHCITNPISINDCANGLLAVGARPIMAEHPAEVAGITASAKALMINLGNITDVRMSSMLIAGTQAHQDEIPCLIDLVGVTCSELRMNYAIRFVNNCHPCVIKGNFSEILAFCGRSSHAAGIDAGEEDQLCENNLEDRIRLFHDLAVRTDAVILITGRTDMIVSREEVLLCDNGTPVLSRLTGTGCMLGALTAAFLTVGTPAEASAYTVCLMGIAGEQAAALSHGMGSFHTELINRLDLLTDHEVCSLAKLIFLPQ